MFRVATMSSVAQAGGRAACQYFRSQAGPSQRALQVTWGGPQGRRNRSTQVRAEDAEGRNSTLLGDTAQHKEMVTFNPMEEGREQLVAVEQAKQNSPAIEDSLARINYHPTSEAAVNEQINHEYTMSYVYHAMSNYFARDNVGLPGFAAFFRASSLEERTHAQMLMDFQSRRGGRVKLQTLAAPESHYDHSEKGDGLHAMELALSLEKLNFEYLFRLHGIAESNDDPEMTNFVEDMLEEQAAGVRQVADYVSKLRRVGKGLGVYEFDKEMAAVAATMGGGDPILTGTD